MQKSITSFFTKTVPIKKKDPTPDLQSSDDENDESEKKTTKTDPNESMKKTKRMRVLSSDEENEDEVIKTSPPKKKQSISGTPKKTSPKTPTKSVQNESPEIKKEEEEEKGDSPLKKSPTIKKEKTPKNKKTPKTPKITKKEKSPETPKIEKIETEETPKTPRTEEKKSMNFFTNKKDLKLQAATTQGADYDPSVKNYHPIDDAFWKRGEKTPYLALARTFQLIEEQRGRNKNIETLSNFFRSVIVLNPSELVPCIYLCLNQLAPAYVGLELGIAETYLMKAIGQSTGRTLAQIKADAHEIGDLGIVAEKSKSSQRMMFTPAALTIEGVFTKLKEIASFTGSAVMTKKIDKIQSMFVACSHSESRFIIRSLSGNLGIGLGELSVLPALGIACACTPPNQKDYPPKILNSSKKLGEVGFKAKCDEATLIIKTTYFQCPNYEKIIPVLLEHGIDALAEKCPMIPGTPLKPMLAHPTKGVQEVLNRFGDNKFTCEWKYDGERAQIHFNEDGTINIYSRNMENNTTKFPDIISRINATKKDSVISCIMDSEVVAWDPDRKQILPFQILSTRKRKDANEDEIKVKVCVYMFDLLYLNSEPLVTRPFIERRKLLHENFNEVEGEWKFATFLDTSDIDEVQSFMEESMKGNCEGLMVKTLEQDATYEIAKRSRSWLKLKKDYLSGVGDSLDVVVIGGYRGRGKRTGGFGAFLLACYDPENEEYQSICKIGTGFTDEDLLQHTEFLKKNICPAAKSYYRYDSSHEPDDWFEPVQVWEIKCADLSLSPVHRAGMGIVDPEKGISLRFPRFIRIRDDKKVEDATSAQQVADMYSNQDQIKNQLGSGKVVDGEDFY